MTQNLEIFKYIETHYNTKRVHSTPGYQSPIDFEKKTTEGTVQSAGFFLPMFYDYRPTNSYKILKITEYLVSILKSYPHNSLNYV